MIYYWFVELQQQNLNLETEGKISQAVLIFLNTIILEAATWGVL